MRLALVALMMVGCSGNESVNSLDGSRPDLFVGQDLGSAIDMVRAFDGGGSSDLLSAAADLAKAPADLTPAADLAPQFDMVQPTCDAVGGTCCVDTSSGVAVYGCAYDRALTCNTSTMKCEACGGGGQQCCLNSNPVQCFAGRTCEIGGLNPDTCQ